MRNNDMKLIVIFLIAQIYLMFATLFFVNSYSGDMMNMIYGTKEEKTNEVSYRIINDKETKKEEEFKYNLKNDIYCGKNRSDYINKTVKILNEYGEDIEKGAYTQLTALKEIRIVNEDTATGVLNKKRTMGVYFSDSRDIEINCDVLNLSRGNVEKAYVTTIGHEYYHYLSHKVSKHDKLNILLGFSEQNENSLKSDYRSLNLYNRVINDQINEHFKVLLKDSFRRVRQLEKVYGKDGEHEEYQADLFGEYIFCVYKDSKTDECNKLNKFFGEYFKNYLKGIIMKIKN